MSFAIISIHWVPVLLIGQIARFSAVEMNGRSSPRSITGSHWMRHPFLSSMCVWTMMVDLWRRWTPP
nr:MAG TPA: hypothetical protein [Caudoviricetes sp.]